MRRVTACALGALLAGVLWIELPSAESCGSVGYSEDTVIQGDVRECVGALIYNHDNSFENGYCWQVLPVEQNRA